MLQVFNFCACLAWFSVAQSIVLQSMHLLACSTDISEVRKYLCNSITRGRSLGAAHQASSPSWRLEDSWHPSLLLDRATVPAAPRSSLRRSSPPRYGPSGRVRGAQRSARSAVPSVGTKSPAGAPLTSRDGPSDAATAPARPPIRTSASDPRPVRPSPWSGRERGRGSRRPLPRRSRSPEARRSPLTSRTLDRPLRRLRSTQGEAVMTRSVAFLDLVLCRRSSGQRRALLPPTEACPWTRGSLNS